MTTLTRAETEWRLLYSAVVAGKSAVFADRAMSLFMAAQFREETPFEFVKRIDGMCQLRVWLTIARTGNYTKLERCFRGASKLDAMTCTCEELEAVHGIGPKTARFFLLWTRPGVRHAALDVHVLRWLREQGYAAPRSTPSGPKYLELERVFLAESDKRGMTPRELDSEIWERYSGYAARAAAGIA